MILPARSAASARICSPRHNTFYRRQGPSRRLFCNMDIKVYFAGSIRGGRADAALYQELIAHIKKSAVVLTEHVGDTSLSALERGPEGDRAIYEQDTAWLRECDIVIAECTVLRWAWGMSWRMPKSSASPASCCTAGRNALFRLC